MKRSEATAMLMSWARVFIAAGLATFTAIDTFDWQIALNTALCATIPVILRYLDPNDVAYGKKSGNE